MSGTYRTIVADPPWPYRSGTLVGRGLTPPGRAINWRAQKTRGIGDRYPVMSVAAICALRIPAAEEAHLYLWTTNAFMVEAHDVARAWGFSPKTILTWTKVKPDGAPSMRAGYWFRGATEHVVFAVRGTMRLRGPRPLPTAFLWPRLPHSVKPEHFFDLVEEASPGPYLELFARRRRLGWDALGDAIDGRDITEAIAERIGA